MTTHRYLGETACLKSGERSWPRLAAVALAAATAGCEQQHHDRRPCASAPHSPSGTITVFAAASLQGAFTTIGKQFEAASSGHDGQVQLRAEFGPGRPDQVRLAGRRVRVGEHAEHDPGRLGRGRRRTR